MVLESNVTNNCLVISFNSPKTSNSISADDWKELKEIIKEFEKSETKYLVLNRVNDNFSSGAQLAENLNASMEDVSEASKMLWECKKPVIAVVDGVCACLLYTSDAADDLLCYLYMVYLNQNPCLHSI